MEVLSKVNYRLNSERLNLNRLIRYFNQVNRRYFSLERPTYRVTNWVYNHLQLEPGEIILDLSCHHGDIWLENDVSLCPFIKVFLADQYLVNIRLTQQRLLKQSFEYDIRLMDYNHLQYESNVFDKVITKLGFNVLEINEHYSMIRECHRVLNSIGKGYFLINENKIQSGFNQILNDFDSNLKELEFIQVDKKSIMNYVSSFFKDVEVQTYENELRFTSAKQLIDFYISNKHDAFVEHIVKKHRIQEFNIYLQNKISQLGSISIEISFTMFIGEGKIC